MKKQFFILSLSALTLFSCGGNQQRETTKNTENTKADSVKTVEIPAEKPVEKPKPPEPYSVDNFSGKFVETPERRYFVFRSKAAYILL